jgi:hypothetical protein
MADAGGYQAGSGPSVVHRPVVRWSLFIGALLAIGYGAWLGTGKGASGVAIAAGFGFGLVLLIVALAGQLPSNLKVGEVQLDLYGQGKADGMAEGAKLVAKAAAGMSPDQAVTAADQNLPPRAPRKAALNAVKVAAGVVQQAAATDPDKLTDAKADLLERIASA